MNAPGVRSLLYSICCLGLTLLAACGGGAPVATGADLQFRPAPDGWTVMGPGGGGSTFIPVFHPTDPQRIMIRCDMTGSYLTRDGGQSWQMLNFPDGVSCFAYDPLAPDRIYVGGHGLYRSRDGGQNWEQLFPAPQAVQAIVHQDDHAEFRFRTSDNYPGGRVEAILPDPEKSGLVFAGISSAGGRGRAAGLYRSEDDGKTWSEVASFDSPLLALFADPAHPDQVIVFCRNSYNTYDKNSHKVETRALPEGMSAVVSVSAGVDPDKPGLFRIWAVSAPGALGAGLPGKVFTCEDAGMTWNEITGNIMAGNPVSAGSQAPSFTWVASSQGDSRSAYLVCSRYMQDNSSGKAGYWYGIFRTSDAGKSWRWVYKAGGGSGRYAVRDGAEAENVEDSWVRQAFGGDFILAICTAVSPSDPDKAIFTDWYRTMKTEDGGATWTALYARNLPDSSVASRGLDVTTCYGVHFDPFDPQHIAISYTDIGFFHSFNGGKSWYRSVNGVPREWENTCYWMAFDPQSKGRLWSVWSSWHDIPRFKMIRRPNWQEFAQGGVCVSRDDGRTWQVSSQGLPEHSPTTCIALDPDSPTDSRILYVTAYGQGVYKSTDGGATWAQKNGGLSGNHNVWQVKLVDSRTLYLVVTPSLEYGDSGNTLVDGEVYRTDDGGENWRKLGLPAGAKFPNTIEIDPTDSQRLYLACWADLNSGDFGGGSREQVECQGGVLLSEDGGASWKQVYDPSAYVYAVTVDPRKGGRVYLNTFHNGAFRSDDKGTSWNRIDGYNFYWGHRVIPDPQDPDKVYLTTFGGSVFHGAPTVDGKL